MLEISSSLSIPESEIQVDFIHASGPGGQNVNKVATAVQLRFDVLGSTALPVGVKQRLYHLAGKRMTDEGVLLIVAKRHRSQEQNREDAVQRLITLIQKAAQQPKPRRKTKPSASAKAARLEAKKRRGAVKRLRSTKDGD